MSRPDLSSVTMSIDSSEDGRTVELHTTWLGFDCLEIPGRAADFGHPTMRQLYAASVVATGMLARLAVAAAGLDGGFNAVPPPPMRVRVEGWGLTHPSGDLGANPSLCLAVRKADRAALIGWVRKALALIAEIVPAEREGFPSIDEPTTGSEFQLAREVRSAGEAEGAEDLGTDVPATVVTGVANGGE